jgi:hypothetical protein
MSDACMNADVLQFQSWCFVSTHPHSQVYAEGGCREKKALETKTPSSPVTASSMLRKVCSVDTHS